MPMYEYVCDDCGFGFERVQSFHDEPLATCPECGGTVRRVISAVGIIFKGSGWYITDSRRQIAASGGVSDRSKSTPDTAAAETTAPAAADAKAAPEAAPPAADAQPSKPKKEATPAAKGT